MTLVATGNYEDNVVEIGDRISKLSSLQAKNLLEYLKNEYGIEPVSSNVVMTEEKKDDKGIIEEPTSFDFVIKEVNAEKRVGVIKVIRTATGLGLMEAKKFLDTLPQVLKEAMPKEEAEKLKKEIEDAGGKVELK